MPSIGRGRSRRGRPCRRWGDRPGRAMRWIALSWHVKRSGNLAPSAEADGYTLARRLALDLTGLPPTLDQVNLLAGGDDDSAYERLVDQLLASPNFGEHWARRWMDLARYADSAGYGSDPLRPNLWPWRDWVIAALNRNLPYDQFTIEQLAGDLIPDATEDQLVATGFHRNTMTNTEGGTDDEEYRVAAVKDRANTTAQVWMGLTLGCAQCHTHKFDPISQREYYQFYGLFNQTEDHDQPDERPTLPRPTASEARRMAELMARIAGLEEQWARNSPELDADLAVWEGVQRQGVEWQSLVPAGWRSHGGAKSELLEDGFLQVRSSGGTDTQVLTVPLDLQGATALRIELASGRSTTADETDRSGEIPLRLTEMKVAVRAPDAMMPRARYVRIELPGPRRVLSLAEVQVLGQGANLALTGIATQSSTEGAGGAERAIDGNHDGDFASGTVTETRPQDGPWWEVDLGSEQSLEAILVWNRTDGGLGTRMTDFQVIALDGKREPVWSKGVGNAPNPVMELRLPAETSLVLENATTRFPRSDHPVEQVVDGNLDAGNGWAPGSANGRMVSAVFEVRDARIPVTNSLMTVELTWSGVKNWELDSFRLSATTRPHPVRELTQELREILAVGREESNPRADRSTAGLRPGLCAIEGGHRAGVEGIASAVGRPQAGGGAHPARIASRKSTHDANTAQGQLSGSRGYRGTGCSGRIPPLAGRRPRGSTRPCAVAGESRQSADGTRGDEPTLGAIVWPGFG